MKLSVISSSSAGNCYLLEGKTSALILECGVSLEKMLRNYGGPLGKIAGCVISHEHGDHAAYAAQYAKLGIKIISAQETLEAIKLAENRRARAIRHGSTITEGEWRISAFNVWHDAVKPLGYIIEHPECGRVLFVTDTRCLDYNFRGLGLDHLMIESNYSFKILGEKVGSGAMDPGQAARIERAHLALESACSWVRANGAGNLKTMLLLHLSDRNSDSAEFQKAMQEIAPMATVAVARPGLKVELDKTIPGNIQFTK